MKSKKYFYDYEDYEDGGKDSKTLINEIIIDPEMPSLDEIVIGCWGECYDNNAQNIIDTIIENKEKFLHIKSLFVGDMDYEECEVSWIEQAVYTELWDALPNLEHLKIKGSSGLRLGNINHSNLKSLEIICGGLPKIVLDEISKANLPNLNKLNLYIGIDGYGFDGDIHDIEKVIQNKSFSNLKYLGLGDSEIQDEIVKTVFENDIVKNLEVLDFSNGTLSDNGGQVILDNIDKLVNIKKLDLHYHFMSDELMKKFESLPFEVDLSEQEKNDEKYGNYPMLTE